MLEASAAVLDTPACASPCARSVCRCMHSSPKIGSNQSRARQYQASQLLASLPLTVLGGYAAARMARALSNSAAMAGVCLSFWVRLSPTVPSSPSFSAPAHWQTHQAADQLGSSEYVASFQDNAPCE